MSAFAQKQRLYLVFYRYPDVGACRSPSDRLDHIQPPMRIVKYRTNPAALRDFH
jgi:hypothetical protein